MAYPYRKYRPETQSRFLPSDAEESDTPDLNKEKKSTSSTSAGPSTPIPPPAPGSKAELRANLKRIGFRGNVNLVIAARDKFNKQ